MIKRFRIYQSILLVLVAMACSCGWTLQIVGKQYELHELETIGFWILIPALFVLLIITITGFVIFNKVKTNQSK